MPTSGQETSDFQFQALLSDHTRGTIIILLFFFSFEDYCCVKLIYFYILNFLKLLSQLIQLEQ